MKRRHIGDVNGGYTYFQLTAQGERMVSPMLWLILPQEKNSDQPYAQAKFIKVKSLILNKVEWFPEPVLVKIKKSELEIASFKKIMIYI